MRTVRQPRTWRLKGRGIAYEHTHGNLWTRCTLRKPNRCCDCHDPIPKGSDAYRPITEGNGTVRYERLCLSCLHYHATLTQKLAPE